MYGRTTKIFFGFMAFIMVVGYPVLMLTAVPSFQTMLLGQQSAEGATAKNVEEARERVVELECGANKRPTGERLEDCKTALQDLGAGYQALAYPTEEEQLDGKLPPNSDEKLDKSLEAFKLLAQIDPEDEESQQFLGTAYAQQGMYQQALAIYDALVEDDPENSDLVFAQASAAQSAGDTEKALRSYRRFIKLAPEDSRADTAKDAIEQIENPEAAGLDGGNLPINIG